MKKLMIDCELGENKEIELTQEEIDALKTPSDVIKVMKITEASHECETRIFSGFESSCLGNPMMFDCTSNDQASINGLATVAMAGLMGLTTEETHWKGTGEIECYKFEYAQIMQLAIDMKRHIEMNINQFNVERLAILSE